MPVPGAGTIVLQVYFKDGTLRTVEKDEFGSTKWDPVEGKELKFATVSQKKGTYHLDFLKDEQGRYTRFRIVNETAKMDATGIQKTGLDDAKADPASSSDAYDTVEWLLKNVPNH